MATIAHTPTPKPVDEQEAFELLDKQARARLGMSGQEFIERWDAGEWDDAEPEDPAVLKLAMLLPLVRSE